MCVYKYERGRASMNERVDNIYVINMEKDTHHLQKVSKDHNVSATPGPVYGGTQVTTVTIGDLLKRL